MILDAWKPKTKKINGKQEIIYHYKLEDTTKLNTNTKVRWVCDDPKCKTPNKIHCISVGHLDKKRTKHNTLESQVCHSCQMSGEGNPMFGNEKNLRELMGDDTKYFKLIESYKERWSGDNNVSHREDVKIKKNQFVINEDNLKNLLLERGETLISYSGNNKNCLLTIKCVNNHVRTQKYSSWVKGHGCKECYWDSIGLSEEYRSSYELYKKIVYKHTRKSNRKYAGLLNPKGCKRGNGLDDCHLDHKYSISEGFKNGVLPSIIGSHHNLEYIPKNDNLVKLDKCNISLSYLCDIYYKNKK